MKTPTEDLLEEHSGIMLMLRILQKVALKLKKGEEVNKEHLTKIIEFLQVFVDTCHHGKEEGILFPVLAKTTSNQNIIDELKDDHVSGSHFISRIATLLEKEKIEMADADAIAENADEYIKLLTAHIQKENEFLFPLIDQQIPESEQVEIEKLFDILERDEIGEGKHEEYHGWLKELKDIYIV